MLAYYYISNINLLYLPTILACAVFNYIFSDTVYNLN
jgi:hypothetical protein